MKKYCTNCGQPKEKCKCKNSVQSEPEKKFCCVCKKELLNEFESYPILENGFLIKKYFCTKDFATFAINLMKRDYGDLVKL